MSFITIVLSVSTSTLNRFSGVIFAAENYAHDQASEYDGTRRRFKLDRIDKINMRRHTDTHRQVEFMVTNAMLRDRRKRLLTNMLESMKGLPEERILAIFSTQQCISLRKAKEYLQEIKLMTIRTDVPITYVEAA